MHVGRGQPRRTVCRGTRSPDVSPTRVDSRPVAISAREQVTRTCSQHAFAFHYHSPVTATLPCADKTYRWLVHFSWLPAF